MIVEKVFKKFIEKYDFSYSIENCWKGYEHFKGFYILPHISVTIKRKTSKVSIWFGWIIHDFVIHFKRGK